MVHDEDASGWLEICQGGLNLSLDMVKLNALQDPRALPNSSLNLPRSQRRQAINENKPPSPTQRLPIKALHHSQPILPRHSKHTPLTCSPPSGQQHLQASQPHLARKPRRAGS